MNCFCGFVDCDKSQLNTEQQEEVARASSDRDLQNCLDGIGECDPARLSDRGHQQVARAARVRNLQACLDQGCYVPRNGEPSS